MCALNNMKGMRLKMTKINAYLNNEQLIIERKSIRVSDTNNEVIDLNSITLNKIYKSVVKNINKSQTNTLLLEQEIESQTRSDNGDVLNENVFVYTKKHTIFYYKTNGNTYQKLVKVPRKILKIGLTKHYCFFIFIAFIHNPLHLDISNTQFNLDNLNFKCLNLKSYSGRNFTLLKVFNNLHFISFKLNDVLSKESNINNNIALTLNINNHNTAYGFGKKSKFIKDTRFYYVPFKSTFTKDYVVHFRRNSKGSIIFVRRPKKSIEYNLKFRFFESKFMNIIFFISSYFYKTFTRKKINLYYEKFSSKADEGAFEIFKLTHNSKKSKNYFIINPNCEDYTKIKNTNNVIKQFSLKYYFLIYASSNLIATEVPAHVNILRTNNSLLRKELAKKKNIFLQHGITYLKNLGKNSVFANGTFDYIIASSQKEAEVICDTLNVTEDQVLITGLGIFSNVKYNHINEKSKDTVTIMLTWKPYDEHFEDFTNSSYYKNTIEIYNIVSKYVDKDQIHIIAHPKVFDALNNTDLQENLWQNPISEVLPHSKLMITDYSSICYNSFYQGSGVIFFQPDLKLYEEITGKLLPNKDEYIGPRIFNLNDLDTFINNTITNNKINLSQLRTKQHEKIYKTINEFNDGKNIERIYDKLVDLDIV